MVAGTPDAVETTPAAGAAETATANATLRGRRPIVWLGIAATIVVMAGFVAYAAFIASQFSAENGDDVGRAQPFAGPTGAQASAYGAGRRAPDFTLTALTGVGNLEGRQGQAVRLSDFSGRPVWINIFASWCAPCRAEMPDVNSVYQEVQARDAQAGAADGLELLLVSIGEEPAVVQRYLDSAKYRLPVLVDPSFAITEQYRITGLPTHYFVGRDGVIRDLAVGGRKPNAMRARLAKIL